MGDYMGLNPRMRLITADYDSIIGSRPILLTGNPTVLARPEKVVLGIEPSGALRR